jgi:hypothetical protein
VDPESLKRRYSDVAGMDDYQLDRNYPDKLETELETLGGKRSDADDGDDSGHDEHDEHNSKKRKTEVRRGSKKRGVGRGRPKDRDRRDKGGDGDGGEGMGMVA